MGLGKWFARLMKWGISLLFVGVCVIYIAVNMLANRQIVDYSNAEQAQLSEIIDKYWDNWAHSGFKGNIYPPGEKRVPYGKEDLKKLQANKVIGLGATSETKKGGRYSSYSFGEAVGIIEHRSKPYNLIFSKYFLALLPAIIGILSIIASIPFGIAHLVKLKKIQKTRGK